MAITFTPAGLQTELQSVATAIDSGDYVTARKALVKAGLVLNGLPVEVRARSEFARYREDLAKLEAQLDALEASVTRTDRRRLIRTGLRHGS